MEWLIGIGLAGLFLLFAWSLCATAARADEEAERMHEDLKWRAGDDNN